jgi:hypothetical protein
MLYVSNILNQFYNNIFIKGGCRRRKPTFPDLLWRSYGSAETLDSEPTICPLPSRGLKSWLLCPCKNEINECIFIKY